MRRAIFKRRKNRTTLLRPESPLRKPFSAETEADLRKLARELRLAIKEHVEFAKSSLYVKKAAIIERDTAV